MASGKGGGAAGRAVLSFASHQKFGLGVPLSKSAQKRQQQECAYYAASGSTEEGGKKLELLESSRKLSLAPMMEYTDRHFRHLVRLLSQRTLLYTEMVAANAIVHERDNAIQNYLRENPNANANDAIWNYDGSYLHRFLGQGRVPPLEGASVLQLGGSDPQQLENAVSAVMELSQRPLQGGNYFGSDYTAINLNCGCPSPKVAGKGSFGAALMENPDLVRRLLLAMHRGTTSLQQQTPITLKCRIGTDLHNTPQTTEQQYKHLCHFIETVASSGVVSDFQIHARIAILSKSISPAQNRQIPPLQYDLVHRLVQDYPQLSFTLNGGIQTMSQVQQQFLDCPRLAGVMVGRAWVADPWSFALADHLLYHHNHPPTVQHRWQVLQQFAKHADYEEANMGDPIRIRRFIVKAITGLFAGEPGAKKFRIALDHIASLPKKQKQGLISDEQPPLSELVLDAALQHLSQDALYRTPNESYEKKLWEEDQTRAKLASGTAHTSMAVAEWQQTRKEEQKREKEEEMQPHEDKRQEVSNNMTSHMESSLQQQQQQQQQQGTVAVG